MALFATFSPQRTGVPGHGAKTLFRDRKSPRPKLTAVRERRSYSSGSPFEPRIGFSRATRVGDHVYVSGTGPIWEDGSFDVDPAAQARCCLEIIVDALADLGARPEDVVRTRIYLVDPADIDTVGPVHAEFFGDVRPTATAVAVAALLDPRWRVEIEADAIID